MTDFHNTLLSGLTAGNLRLLRLEPVELPRGRRLEQCGHRTEHVYFLDHGIASVVAAGTSIEIGMIGREGMTGLVTVMGAERASFDTLMQIAGKGWRAGAGAVRNAFDTSESFRHVTLDYARAFLTHLATGSAASAQNTLEERLARWLAVARDRVDMDELSITHELIAKMLGVRRAGVTMALQALQQQRLLRCRRGMIEITNHKGLVSASNGAYARADEMMRSR